MANLKAFFCNLPFYRLHRTLFLTGAVALATAIAIALTYFSPAPKAVEAAKPAASLTVVGVSPTWKQWPATIEASGSIEPWQEAVIGSQLSGMRLAEVLVNVGDEVKKGQLLARFDAEMLNADMEQLKAKLAQAEAAAAQAETNKQRVQKLKGSGSLSQQEILRYETEAETSHAELKAAKAQIALKQLELRYTQVTAPDDGVISVREATLGSVASSGQELFRLIRKNRLEWRGELTAEQMAQCQPGQKIGLNLPDGSHASATLRQLAPTLNPESRLGLVYADLAPGSRARAGMYASGTLVLNESRALTVPAVSVVIRDGRSYVVKLQSSGDVVPAALQLVATGRRQGAEIEILQGLNGDERIVSEGAGFLNDGDLVRIVEQQAQGAAS